MGQHKKKKKNVSKLRCSGVVIRSCSISSARRVTLVTLVTWSHWWFKGPGFAYVKRKIHLAILTQIFRIDYSRHGGDHRTLEVLTSTLQFEENTQIYFPHMRITDSLIFDLLWRYCICYIFHEYQIFKIDQITSWKINLQNCTKTTHLLAQNEKIILRI